MLLKYFFATYKFNPIIIHRVQALLNIKPLLTNELIKRQREVRLVDDNFKLIGIMDFEEAKQRATTSNKDIVLLNDAVEPPLCRICDYSDELAQKFLTEIKPPFKKQRHNRSLEIGHTITLQDMKVKVVTAQIILKKQKRLTISCICPITEVYQSKNIFFKFRDLCAEFMKPIGSIKVTEYDDKNKVIFEPKDEEKQQQMQLLYDFDKIGDVEPDNSIPQLKIERQINQIYALQTRQQEYHVEEVMEALQKYEGNIDKEEEEIPDDDLTNERLWQKLKRKGKGHRSSRPEIPLDDIMKQSENK